MTPRGPMRRWTAIVSVVLAAIVTVGTAARAADPAPPAYALASLIGDELSVVTYRQSVGSARDRNEHQAVPLPDREFDRLALQYAAAAVRRAAPGTETLLLRVTDASAVRTSDALLASPERLRAFVDPIATVLQPRGTRYLLVVTKFRGDSRIQMAEGKVGTGKLSGLGFYLDHRLPTENRTSGERGTGFIAPFVYIEVGVVDLASRTVVRSETATESAALSSSRSASGVDPWEALDPDEKVRLVEALLHRAIDTVVPHVVAPG